MSTIRVVGIDIAKSVFRVRVWMVDGSVAWNKKSLVLNCWILSDSLNLELLLLWKPAPIAFLGENPRIYGLLRQTHPRATGKSFCPQPENDPNDALAICETAFRPGIHFVSVKTTEQQDIKVLRNTRQLMAELIEDASNSLTFTLRRLLSQLREDMKALNERITHLDSEIAALSSQQIAYAIY